MKSILLASAVLLVSVGAARAADFAATAPAGFVWTGGYVGLQAGYAWGDSFHTDENEDRIDYDPRGGFGGAYAGYNYQFSNNVVLGGDADINFSDIDNNRAPFTWGGDTEPDQSHFGTADVKWTGAIRGRLGYAIDRFMPYLAGGVAFAKYDVNLDHGDGYIHFKRSATLTGWTIGGGVEYAATDNLLLRAEYRYTDYGSERWDDDNWGNGMDLDLKTNDIRLGVAYKF